MAAVEIRAIAIWTLLHVIASLLTGIGIAASAMLIIKDRDAALARHWRPFFLSWGEKPGVRKHA
ncbi:MAG TPA: hypothetical protein VG501_01080, partial [Rhizomicrobium sp.]|nr:hypothetical protein [Rhizomicrobium sp.]